MCLKLVKADSASCFPFREAIQSLESENEELMKDNTLAGSLQNQNQVIDNLMTVFDTTTDFIDTRPLNKNYHEQLAIRFRQSCAPYMVL